MKPGDVVMCGDLEAKVVEVKGLDVRVNLGGNWMAWVHRGVLRPQLKVTMGWRWRFENGSRSYELYPSRAVCASWYTGYDGKPVKVVRRVR